MTVSSEPRRTFLCVLFGYMYLYYYPQNFVLVLGRSVFITDQVRFFQGHDSESKIVAYIYV